MFWIQIDIKLFENEQVLVTGGGGLIGQQLIQQLLDKNAIVRTVIGSRSLPTNLASKVQSIKTDLVDPKKCQEIMEEGTPKPLGGMSYLVRASG